MLICRVDIITERRVVYGSLLVMMVVVVKERRLFEQSLTTAILSQRVDSFSLGAHLKLELKN